MNKQKKGQNDMLLTCYKIWSADIARCGWKLKTEMVLLPKYMVPNHCDSVTSF